MLIMSPKIFVLLGDERYLLRCISLSFLQSHFGLVCLEISRKPPPGNVIGLRHIRRITKPLYNGGVLLFIQYLPY